MRDRLERLSWRRALLAAFALGLASALALPPVHAVPVLLLSIPGLLVLAGAARDWQRAAWIAFAWGWGHHLAGIYWVTHAILTEVETFWWLVPLAAPGLAVPLALFAVPPVLLARALPGNLPRVLGFAAAWVGCELLRGVLFTGFPWNLMGTVWAFAALPVQAASVIGVHGLSLATMLLAGLPLLGRRALAAGCAVLLGFGGYGAWRLAAPGPEDAGPYLVLVQGNVAQDLKWREDQRRPIFERYLELTERAGQGAIEAAPAGQPVIVVWPETASPFLLGQDPEARRAAAASLPPGGTLVAGTLRAEWGPDGALRQVFNALVVLDDRAEVLARYDKAHLVPFGEYMPLAGLIPIRLVTGGMDISAGPGRVVLAPPGLPPFSALICYEIIFSGAVAGSPASGPRPAWLVNITNDAWFGHSAGPWQHLATARLRAVEEGLPVARAAQTGISALFDGHGRRLLMLPTGATGTLSGPLPGALAPTPFARFGLLVPGGLAVASLLLALGAAWWARRPGHARSCNRAGDAPGWAKLVIIEKS